MPKSGELEEARSGPKVLSLGCTRESLDELFKGADPQAFPKPTPPSRGVPIFFKVGQVG